MLAMLADQPDQALRIEDRGQIELGRGLLAVAHHAAQMRRVDARAQPRYRLEVAFGDVDDLLHRVDQHAQRLRAAVVGQADIDDDDAGAPADDGGGQAEPGAEVDHRHDDAAQVHHAANEGRHQRQRRHVADLEDLAHQVDAHRAGLQAEREAQELVQRRSVVLPGRLAVTAGGGSDR